MTPPRLEPQTDQDRVAAVEALLREWVETGKDQDFATFLRHPFFMKNGKRVVHSNDSEGSTTAVPPLAPPSAGLAFIALTDALDSLGAELRARAAFTTTEDAARSVIRKAREIAKNTYERDEGRHAFGERGIRVAGPPENVVGPTAVGPDIDADDSVADGRDRRQNEEKLWADLSLDRINENRSRMNQVLFTPEDQHKKFSARTGLVRMGYTEPRDKPEIRPMTIVIRWACLASADQGHRTKASYGSTIFRFTDTQVRVLQHMSLILRNLLDVDPRYLPAVDALEHLGFDPTGREAPDGSREGQLNTPTERSKAFDTAILDAVQGAARISGEVIGRDYAKTLRTWHESRAKVVAVLYLMGALGPRGALRSVENLSEALEKLDREFADGITDKKPPGKVLKVLKAAATVSLPNEWGAAKVTDARWRKFIAGRDGPNVEIRKALTGLLGDDQVKLYPVRSLHWCEDVVAARMGRDDPECVIEADCDGHPLEDSGLAAVRDGVSR